ncbi:MAG: permease-like cell division protein FtsX [Elusimicrobiales bacterium]|jgi:cell division protein FtsX
MEAHSHQQRHQAVEEYKKNRKGYRVVFLTVFAGALMVEALLFMRVQVREIALILKEDFRIVVVKNDNIKQDSAGMEEAFKALPGTAEVSFISKAERLRKLREEDPDLVGAVMNMGANPLPDSFEISLEEAALGDLTSWVEAAWKINGVGDIKYKPLEAYAILHALFYGHYLLISLALACVALALMALMTVLYRNTVAGLLTSLRRDRNWFFTGLLAGALAEVISYAIVYPVKYLSPLWLWPGAFVQAAVIAAGGVFAWVIFQWKNTHD